ILPADPVVAFCANLIEDYADEWLWRAAMHYRWSYDHDRELLSRILADEQTRHLKLPRLLRRRMVKKRQLTGFVVNDGVTSSTRAHVEAGYHRILTLMSTALQNRPFVLGHRPSLADVGLMGPMLRHFAQDPTPAEIMRDTAPDVFAWVARMWNAGAGDKTGALLPAMPEDLQPMLQEIVETHLVQLRANAAAWHAGQATFAMQVQGCSYQDLPVSRYRVYCLEQLRSAFAGLDAVAQTQVRELLPWPDATLLWEPGAFQSDYDPESLAPFNKAINVFRDGVPS
ncbi:MAG: glutathione S-transferase domain-containing protein, partial [Pseudomonadota bacterium]